MPPRGQRITRAAQGRSVTIQHESLPWVFNFRSSGCILYGSSLRELPQEAQYSACRTFVALVRVEHIERNTLETLDKPVQGEQTTGHISDQLAFLARCRGPRPGSHFTTLGPG